MEQVIYHCAFLHFSLVIGLRRHAPSASLGHYAALSFIVRYCKRQNSEGGGQMTAGSYRFALIELLASPEPVEGLAAAC